jgi:hypothetical protein
MFKWKATDRWHLEMAGLEEGCDVGAINPNWLKEASMEKLGIANTDLVNELKNEYKKLREDEAHLLKTGQVRASTQAELARVKARIRELEAEHGREK